MWIHRLFTKKRSLLPWNPMATQFHASFHEANNNKFAFNRVRLAVRQRRGDRKRALEDFLHKNGSSFLEDESWRLDWKAGLEDKSDNLRRSKCSSPHAQKHHHKKNKRKSRRGAFYESFDDHPDAYSYSNSDSNSRHRSKTWGGSSSESECEDNSRTGDRALLGLPPSGPLKLEDVKMAFREAALKWHPDKHIGPGQAMAEEKFKQCVDAYRSLCKMQH